ncbi:hypothetical protein TNCV_2869781 [Trichonephila clavipes]|nr:hypothetical protein TNCV_2869781 [Trichonephila clavipes]
MDYSRPKVLKSKIPVKIPVKSRIQLSIPITERETIEKEGKEKSHTQSTTVKKRIHLVKVQQTVNSSNKYNCTSKAAKCSSTNYCRRSEIKTELKKPVVPVEKKESKQFRSTTFKTKTYDLSKMLNKETKKKNDLSVKNGNKREVKQNKSNLTKKKNTQSDLQKNDFPMSESEKQSKNSNHISQQNIIFEADERFRHHILSGKDLTPSMLNSWSSKKQSSTEKGNSTVKGDQCGTQYKCSFNPKEYKASELAESIYRDLCDPMLTHDSIVEQESNLLFDPSSSNENDDLW